MTTPRSHPKAHMALACELGDCLAGYINAALVGPNAAVSCSRGRN